MDTPFSTQQSTRRRLAVAGALVAVTAIVGSASHRSGAAAPPAGGAGPAGTSTVPPATPSRLTAPATGPVRFAGQVDRSAVRVGGDGLVRIELTVAADRHDVQEAPRVPTDLVVVLDRSGSMDGDKIVHARAAVHELVGRLGVQDRFALVSYADDATVTVPLAHAEDAARARWRAVVAGIEPGGGTNMSAGLDLVLRDVVGAATAGRASRLILISDGLANQGDTSPEGLMARARRAARSERPLTAVGVGTDFNEALMTALADAGTGSYYFVERATDLGAVFAREFGAARATVASAVAVEIDPAPGVRVIDAAGYPLEHAGGRVVFRPGTLFGGQERRIWVTLSVPHDEPAERALGTFALSWADGGGRQRLALPGPPTVACVANDDAFFAGVDVPAWERGVAVDDFNKMQDEVARRVQAGERDAALGAVQRFHQEAAGMNARLASPAVAESLRQAKELEGRVADAFAGAEQRAKQNRLGKAAGAAAYDARRPGSKYQGR